jgi:hypothetical protein
VVRSGCRTKTEMLMGFAARASFHGKCADSTVLQSSRNIQVLS